MYVQYKCNQHSPDCMIHISNHNFFSYIFDLQLVESVNVEPTNTEGQLYNPEKY
jgi:hypothetical protein